MNATELTKLTIKELKAIAQEKGIEVSGDKRSKATWVLALSALTQTSEPSAEIIEPAPIIKKVLNSKSTIESDSPVELVVKSSGIDSPIPEPETKPQPQQRGASTVGVIVVLVFGVAFLIIKMGFTAIVWVITALIPLALEVWRYLFPEPNPLLDAENFSPNLPHELSIDPSGLTLTL